MVGNNTPIFFIRDPLKFPDFIHTQKRCPANNLKDSYMRWDYWSQSPEALHQITILYSDRGIPRSYRHMNGYGSHTYSLINEDNQRVWVKFHFKTLQGIKNLTEAEAAKIKAQNPDHATEDLWDAIKDGYFPRWRFCIQVMTEEQAASHSDNPFDLTKVWKHSDYPLIEVGILELNRNPDNYFAQIEQAAFSPSAIVPGIGFSPDKVLQARVMSYTDAHRYRIGTNYQQLPVNLPKCSFAATYQRNGVMAYGDNGGSTANYEPNSDPTAPKPNIDYREPPLSLGDVVVDRYARREGNDEYSQTGDLYRLLDKDAKQRLVANIVGSLEQVPEEIQLKQLCHFFRADSDYGMCVAKRLGIQVDPTMLSEAAQKLAV